MSESIHIIVHRTSPTNINYHLNWILRGNTGDIDLKFSHHSTDLTHRKWNTGDVTTVNIQNPNYLIDLQHTVQCTWTIQYGAKTTVAIIFFTVFLIPARVSSRLPSRNVLQKTPQALKVTFHPVNKHSTLSTGFDATSERHRLTTIRRLAIIGTISKLARIPDNAHRQRAQARLCEGFCPVTR